ncbi:MAG: ribosome biogenesis GTPase Der [Chloroflexi bacterium RBG_13_56_8]|nr:MAG: ribosome biogenesis GTPase Der [Chloroflexi bacterium RBG_13_56_8]
MPQKPLVALVGRPNVGKSTLFNRLIGRRAAIVEDTPGTTRDRQYGDVAWGGHAFTLIDTGGLVLNASDRITELVRAQAQAAIEEADVIVLLTDIVDGITPADEEIVEVLRHTQKPIILAVNKADNLKRELEIHEFRVLGLGEPLAISAIRGLATGDLLDRIVETLPSFPTEEEEPGLLHIAIVGRPNVGKSSLLNRMLGYERVIVDEAPGTTRDAIDTIIRYHEQEMVLIDTAGIRRRGHIQRGTEKFGVLRAVKAIQRADVVLLLIDAPEGITNQDTHVAGYILEQAKSVIVLINKWDLIEKDSHTLPQYEEYVRRHLKFMPYVPVLFVSALTGQRVGQILPVAIRINEQRQHRLSTSEINNLIRQATARHSPPTKWGRKLRIYYGTQVSVSPPTLVLFVNDEKLAHFSYTRYLENQIRREFPFEGTPLKIVFRGHNPTKEREG